MPLDEGIIQRKCEEARNDYKRTGNLETARNHLIEIFDKNNGEKITSKDFAIKNDMAALLINPKGYKLLTLFTYAELLELQNSGLKNCWLGDAGQILLNNFPKSILVDIALTSPATITELTTTKQELLKQHNVQEIIESLNYNSSHTPKRMSL